MQLEEYHMENRLRKLVTTGLVAIMAILLCATDALAGGYRNGYGHNYHGGNHGNHYSSNQMWAAVGVGVLGGALIGAAAARPAPVYYQEQPTVYVQPPVYVQQPVYMQPPAYMQPPPASYLRYDPRCGCLR